MSELVGIFEISIENLEVVQYFKIYKYKKNILIIKIGREIIVNQNMFEKALWRAYKYRCKITCIRTLNASVYKS